MCIICNPEFANGLRALSFTSQRPLWTPSARDIWISSGLRGARRRLRKSADSGGWISLEFLGFSRPK